MSQPKKPWWKKNPGFTVQGTFSTAESNVLEVIEEITGKTLGVRDIRGTRQIKRVGEHVFRGNIQLFCFSLPDCMYNKFEFCLREVNYFDSVEIVIAYQSFIKDPLMLPCAGKVIYTRYFLKTDKHGDFFEELPLDRNRILTELWGDKIPALYTDKNIRILQHIQMNESGLGFGPAKS